MTLAEKILAHHAGRDKVSAGEIVMAKLDMILGTDVTVPLSAEVFNEMGAETVADPDKIALINDHFVPAKDVKAATLSKIMREFARKQKIKNYFEVGRSGICHAILPDNGLVRPGDLIVGADSHTCTYGALGAFATGIGSTDLACAWALGELWFRVPETIKIEVKGRFKPFVGAKDLILHIISVLGVDGALYKALEFTGDAFQYIGIDGRFTIANMAIEAGAKTGLIPPDDITRNFMAQFPDREGIYYQSDEDSEYSQVMEFDLDEIGALVAEPYLPSNAKPVKDVAGQKIDQVVIGSCTNGRLDDFRVAAKIMGEYPVHPNVRLIMIPGTPKLMRELLKEQLIDQFVKAGAVISPPTCGPCIGGHMGVLAAGEVGLFTTNRNFKGRNGHPDSKVYLAGPAVAAASAVTGRITDPADLVKQAI